MAEPRKTGRIRWDMSNRRIQLIQEEWINHDGEIVWIYLMWAVCKAPRSFKWCVMDVTMYNLPAIRVIRTFWRLKNAKAFVEVTHRMGVEL